MGEALHHVPLRAVDLDKWIDFRLVQARDRNKHTPLANQSCVS
jgi:hypothetical protein